ncbi:MAG: LLM class flavin-dependent oxidoreductase, partial [Acidimicrobiia bacterium]|nr:LLM class flavin-dependent oxidoreductase [Acidimicrobiia bacterium]
QEMSDGRLVCGLGMGHRDDEFAAFEILRSQRRKHLEETVELLRLLWTEEDVTYQGEIHQIANVNVLPKPDPVPPIWIGGWAPPAVRRAARIADAWFPGPSADLGKLRECYSIYDKARTETGMPPGARPLMREVWVGETQTEIDRGRRHLQRVYQEEYPSIANANVGLVMWCGTGHSWGAPNRLWRIWTSGGRSWDSTISSPVCISGVPTSRRSSAPWSSSPTR